MTITIVTMRIKINYCIQINTFIFMAIIIKYMHV